MQADAFSYGVVVWELVTKEQTRRGNWRPVRVPEECPAEVEQLIADCLTEDVERRPSMREVVERLVALDQSSRPIAVTASIPPQPVHGLTAYLASFDCPYLTKYVIARSRSR